MPWNFRAMLEGAARVFDLGGQLECEIADDPNEADARATRSDWEAVGRDLIAAAEKLKKQGG